MTVSEMQVKARCKNIHDILFSFSEHKKFVKNKNGVDMCK